MNVPFDRQIWTGQQCADYLGQSYSQFMDETRQRKDFPPELRNLPERWRAAAVSVWKPTTPMPAASLYRAYAADGTLLYVGISWSAMLRIAQHRQQAEWFPLAATIRLEHFETRELARAAEKDAIANERPTFNVRT